MVARDLMGGYMSAERRGDGEEGLRRGVKGGKRPELTLDLLCKQLASFILWHQSDILGGWIFVFDPVKDEMRFIDSIVFGRLGVDENGKLLQGVVLGCLCGVVPGNFGQELKWDGFLQKGNPDFSRIRRA